MATDDRAHQVAPTGQTPRRRKALLSCALGGEGVRRAAGDLPSPQRQPTGPQNRAIPHRHHAGLRLAASLGNLPAMNRPVLAGVASLVFVLGPASPALAHNHVLNPSGACNASDPCGGPGATGGFTNPAGKLVAQAKAYKARGDERCRR